MRNNIFKHDEMLRILSTQVPPPKKKKKKRKKKKGGKKGKKKKNEPQNSVHG